MGFLSVAVVIHGRKKGEKEYKKKEGDIKNEGN
jgi:hypothetical protein